MFAAFHAQGDRAVARLAQKFHRRKEFPMLPITRVLKVRAVAWVLPVVLACVFATGSDLDEARERDRQGVEAKRSDALVKVQAAAERPDATGKTRILVTLTIDQGWHLTPNPPPGEAVSIPTTIVVVAGKQPPRDVHIHYPPGQSIYEPTLRANIPAYVDRVTIPM